MAKITLNGGGAKYINFSEKKGQAKKGDSWTGTYLGSTQGQYGMNHRIQTESGLVSLNGVAQLDRLMEKVEPNTPITIKYEGKVPSSKDPNKRVHSFDIDGTERSVLPEPKAAASNFKF